MDKGHEATKEVQSTTKHKMVNQNQFNSEEGKCEDCGKVEKQETHPSTNSNPTELFMAWQSSAPKKMITSTRIIGIDIKRNNKE